MDRVNSASSSTQRKRQILGLLLIVLILTGILGYKIYDEGWLLPRAALDLPQEPVLLFFNRHKGCECVLLVYRSADKQIQDWPESQRNGLTLIRVDLDRRPDLGAQFGIYRVPAMLLLDAEGREIFRQEESLSDTRPLDLAAFEARIEEVFNGD